MSKPTEAHYHQIETTVYFVLEGCGHIVINGKKEIIQKEMSLVIPPDTIHFNGSLT